MAHALSVQAMTEFAISHNKAKEIPEGLAENAKSLIDIKRDDYDALRLIVKTHSLAFAKALFCFGEARRICRKLVFASPTVKHDPERLINSSIWSESLFPEAIIKEIKDNAEKADKSLMSKWGMPAFEIKRKGQGKWDPRKRKRSSAQPMKICLETPLIIILSLRIDIQTFEGVTVVRGPAAVTTIIEAKTPENLISLTPTKAIRKGTIVATGAATSLAMPAIGVTGE